MKARILVVTILLVVAAWQTFGEAQRVTPAVRRVNSWYRQPTRSRVGNYGNYPQYGYSSTRAEGVGRGMADVIRAGGETAESVSRARMNREDTRSKYSDNQLKWAETYQKRKAMGRAERDRRSAEERVKRDKWLSTRKSNLPPRLGPSQLDPLTGKINWPVTLLGKEYAEQRNILEELFVIRAHTSANSEIAQRVHTVSRQMQDVLKGNIRDILPEQYIAARKFLESLGREAQFPTG